MDILNARQRALKATETLFEQITDPAPIYTLINYIVGLEQYATPEEIEALRTQDVRFASILPDKIGEIEQIESLVAAAAERRGWMISDLNDNPHGMRVKGQNWKAEKEGDPTLRGWTREEVLGKLAEVLFANYRETR